LGWADNERIHLRPDLTGTGQPWTICSAAGSKPNISCIVLVNGAYSLVVIAEGLFISGIIAFEYFSGTFIQNKHSFVAQQKAKVAVVYQKKGLNSILVFFRTIEEPFEMPG
jgi:hypothetical protein